MPGRTVALPVTPAVTARCAAALFLITLATAPGASPPIEDSHETPIEDSHEIAAGLPVADAARESAFEDSHEPDTPAGREGYKGSRLTVVVFTAQLPVAGIEVAIDGAPAGRTDRNGRWAAELPPGAHRLRIETRDQTYRRDLHLVSGEIARLLLNFYRDGRPVYADFETSNPAAGSSAAAPSAPVAAGPPGTLEGVITDAENHRPLAGVRVFASGAAEEIVTGEDGRYRFQLPPGLYAVSVLAARFNTRTLDNIPIASGKITTQNLELTPAGAELPEFVVLAPYLEGSIASVVEERRNATSVTDVLGAEQISRAGDSDAASALKRVTGLTLVNGRFIFIRGLGERYTTTLLNGASVPSPDPTRRVVPLDLFPTDVIASVLVNKSFAAELPAEFGGGIVNLRTQAMPEDFFFKISGSLGYRTSTSFKKGFTYDGGDFDFLGFDDGARDPPPALGALIADRTPFRQSSAFNPDGFTPDEIQRIGRELSGVYDIERQTIRPDSDLTLAIGDSFQIGDWRAGYVASASWDEGFETRDDEIRRTFNIRRQGDEVILINETDLVRQFTNHEITSSVYASAGAQWRDLHEISANTIRLRLTDDLAEITSGFVAEVGDESQFFELEYVANQLFANQFRGHHVFPVLGDLALDWQHTRANASRRSPNERLYRLDHGPDGLLELSTRSDNNATIFSDLQDDSEQITAGLTLPLTFSERFAMKLAAGIDFMNRKRDSVIRRFQFVGNRTTLDPDIFNSTSLEEIFADENIAPDLFRLVETTRGTDNYVAEQDLDGIYGSIQFDLYQQLTVILGLRQEDNFQQATTFSIFNPDAPPIVGLLDTSNLLPSASVTWAFRDDQQLRFAYAETVSRPDFREISPAPFTDPLLDEITIGNPELREASIKHADLRWEYYFSPTEALSVAAFWKSFDDPVEKTIFPGVTPITSFANAESARNIGGEIEVRKQLGFLRRRFAWLPDVFNALTFTGNVLFVDSSLTLADVELDLRTNRNTRIEGQSKYAINLQLGYSDEHNGINADLLYNTVGARIVQRGLLGAPDIEEQPFHQLDFVISKEIGDGFQLKFKARNLLNDTVRFTQGAELTRAFTRGREFTIGFSWAP